MRLIDRICKHLYVLAMLLTVLVFGLTPLHASNTERGNVLRVRADNHLEVAATDLPTAAVGDVTQVYRFNPDWTREIGFATVVERTADVVRLSFDPKTFAWPVGRQGTITEVRDGQLVLDVGTEIDIRPGSNLVLFRGRQRAGRARVAAAGEGWSRMILLEVDGASGSNADASRAVGLQACEFTIPNQVTRLGARWIVGFEWAAFAATMALWFWTIVSPFPGSLLVRAGRWARDAVANASPHQRRLGWTALGVPVCFVGGRIAAWFWLTAPQLAWDALRNVHNWISIVPTHLLRPNLGLPDPGSLPDFLAMGAFVAWVYVALGEGKNPLAMVQEAIRYRREDAAIYKIFSKVPRGILNWALHWMVFYLFAVNLLSFLRANMQAAGRVGWVRHGLVFDTWPDWFRSIAFMAITAPDIANFQQGFEIARYVVWSVCIIGVLFGYWHTLLSILWKPDAIKWIDFTPTGWMVNLLCYGAWAGAVFRVFPHPNGVDPSATEGPLSVLMPATELYLNLVYTWAILSMGSKFGLMVDKGLVDRGFYSVVRHPSYTLEPLMFGVLYLNRITDPIGAVGLLAHPFMYWWRSERDDHFMGIANEDYPAYRERVPYKFVPGLW